MMKKISIVTVLAFYSLASFAQSLDDVNDLRNKKDYAGAKTAIDKFMANPKNADNAEGYYFKGIIYNDVSFEKTTPADQAFELKSASFDALKKSQTLDAKDVRLKLEGYNSYLSLYFGLYDLGANQFSAKNYDGALNAFKKALEVKDYTLGKKYVYSQATLYPLDTSLVLNTAIAAGQAKKEDESVSFYKKLTDANVKGENFREVYEYLAEYYSKKEDAANYAQILQKGKNFYPTDNYWNTLELSNISKKGDQNAVFAKYDEMLAANPNNYALSYNYAVELFKKIYDKDDSKVSSDNIADKEKLTELLKKTIAIDTGIDASLLMSNHLYKMASDYSASIALIKGAKPEDVKKKSELKALSAKKVDECIIYCDKVDKYFEGKTNLKAVQAANYKIVLEYLSELYTSKGDTKKAAEYDKKRLTVK